MLNYIMKIKFLDYLEVSELVYYRFVSQIVYVFDVIIGTIGSGALVHLFLIFWFNWIDSF